MNQAHVFALFSPNSITQAQSIGAPFELHDKDLWNRIVHILRLAAGESVILFDHNLNVTINLLPATFERKGQIVGTVISFQEHQPILPAVHLYACLLKKESFEEIVYVAAQMGVTSITPVLSEKIQRKWGSEKEVERLGKIMIAACEQSKNFVFPDIHQPRLFKDVIEGDFIKNNMKSLVFYEGGQPLVNLIQELAPDKNHVINLMFGPEGGFSNQELKMFQEHQLSLYALTPTILRAKEAITVGVGVVRSITS